MHPLTIFNFCPKCGSKNFIISSDYSKKCNDCGFEYFKNPIIGVAVVITDESGKILCLQRERDPGKGLLGFPGGFVDIGESIEEAAHREVKEETGLKIKNLKLIDNIANSYIYKGMEQYPLDFYFTAEIDGESILTPQEGETSNLKFINIDKTNIDSFAMLSTRIFLTKWLNQ